MTERPSEPPTGDGPRDLAEAKRLSRAGYNAEAWAIAAQRLQHDPWETTSLKLIVQLADRAGWYAAALPYLDAAIPASPAAWQSYWRYRAAYLAREAGQPARATAYLQAIVAHEPNAAAAYNEIGMIYRDAGDLAAALRWVASAQAAAPADAAYKHNEGILHSMRGDPENELAAYRRAVATDPCHGGAQRALVACLERQNYLADAEAALASAEAHVGRTPKLHAMAMRLAQRRGDLENARGLLATLPWHELDRGNYSDALFIAGQIYDRRHESERAMACFAEGNAMLAAMPQAQPFDKTAALTDIAQLRAGITAERVADWPAPQPGPADAATPVFLVGFPRSGTTLLDVALGSHPGVTSLEEEPVVPSVAQVLHDLPPGYPDALFELRPDQLQRLRDLYFHNRAKHLAAGEDRLVVDKLPLNIRHMPLMYRLFPEAKIIFALRHPADVVLSCFMQDFQPNAWMNNFFALADATRLYDRIMGLWRHYLALLPLPVATVPYEALVADFDNVSAQLLGFLGLPWDEAVADYQAHTRGGVVRTPSYAQVSQPLYTSARYRWLRYRDALAPELPTLRAWADWFGYREQPDGTIQAPGFHRR